MPSKLRIDFSLLLIKIIRRNRDTISIELVCNMTWCHPLRTEFEDASYHLGSFRINDRCMLFIVSLCVSVSGIGAFISALSCICFNDRLDLFAGGRSVPAGA